ncbi:hypothetical protein D3C75_307360 [compost metagenome]
MTILQNLARRSIIVLCIFGALLAALPGLAVPAHAAAFEPEFAAAIGSIDQLYDGYTALETAIKLQKSQIQELRSRNDDRQKSIAAKVKLIDKAKIEQLNSASVQVSGKHAALLQQYSDLGKRAAAARKSKDKKSADLLDLQRNKLKPSVEAARLEIKNAKEALAAAKKSASAKAKLVTDALVPVQNLRKQVTAENKKIAAANRTRTAAGKRYRLAVKQGAAITAATEMALMYNELGKINACWKTIYGYEKQIAAALSTAEAKLP